MRGEYWLISQQSVVVQSQRESIQYLPSLLDFTGDESFFDKVAHFDVVHAVKVEVEEVLVVGKFLGYRGLAGECGANDPDRWWPGVHCGFFGFVNCHFYCVYDTAFRQIVYYHFRKFIFLDFFKYFDIFIIIFFFF